ncbi:hypothetical protein pEaSNUABM37_00264 [Erwinia phage pEa_SNUABM_37]|nr:hypothetical protein pEaSNUABM37_00264 [Erwinia phage pEa_SNUABM_37]QXO10732.1 hypothetical protein pEaSNUABM48_00264 [Erwinia phage pEa_SNUABM_48]
MVKRLTANGTKFREVKTPPTHKRGQVLVTILYKKPWHQLGGDIMHARYFVPVHNQDIRNLNNEETSRNFIAATFLTKGFGFWPLTVEIEVIPGSVIKAAGRELLGAVRWAGKTDEESDYYTQSEIIAKAHNKPDMTYSELFTEAIGDLPPGVGEWLNVDKRKVKWDSIRKR